MERKEFLQAIAEVSSQIDKLTRQLNMLKKAAGEQGFLQMCTDINMDLQLMCEILDFNIEDILSPSKKRDLSDTRTIIIHHLVHTFLHQKFKVSKAIHRDHSTVNEALKRHSNLYIIDEDYRKRYDKITDSYYVSTKLQPISDN